MSLLHVNYSCPALKKQSAMFVMIPDNTEGPYRVVYMLHGLSDDYTIWQRRTSIERYAGELGIMVVLLDGARSFYTDMVGCFAPYEQHILEGVRYVDRTFRTIDRPDARGIGGLSMGGYGAMKIGLKYPDLFGSIASHSGVLDMGNRFDDGMNAEFDAIFGKTLSAEDDCFKLAALPGTKPAIYFDCGVDDFLIEHNRSFDRHLTELGVPHTYQEHPGVHCWEYWDTHVPAALDFHLQQFNAVCP